MPATYKHITTELTLHNEQFAINVSLFIVCFIVHDEKSGFNCNSIQT